MGVIQLRLLFMMIVLQIIDQSIFQPNMNQYMRTFRDHLIFRQDRRASRYGNFQHYPDDMKASIESFIQSLPGTAQDNPLKRKMLRLKLHREIFLEADERNLLKAKMIQLDNPEIFESIRKMLVRNYSPYQRQQGDKKTEYDRWRNGITEKYFNKRPTHKSRNPNKAKNKQNYHTDIECCKRRIKKVESEMKSLVDETRKILEERSNLEIELFQIRNDFQQNLIEILEHDGVDGLDSDGLRQRSTIIMKRMEWCDDKLRRSATLSADMSNELICLRQIQYNIQ